jgi:hypothetical protein
LTAWKLSGLRHLSNRVGLLGVKKQWGLTLWTSLNSLAQAWEGIYLCIWSSLPSCFNLDLGSGSHKDRGLLSSPLAQGIGPGIGCLGVWEWNLLACSISLHLLMPYRSAYNNIYPSNAQDPEFFQVYET